MDEQLKELRDLILDMRQHVDGRFNQIEERDQLFREYVDERFTQMHDYVDGRFTEMHDYVDERTRDMETRLLTGFQRWSNSMELTIKPMPIRMASIEERMAIMEERLKDFGKPPLQP